MFNYYGDNIYCLNEYSGMISDFEWWPNNLHRVKLKIQAVDRHTL